MSNHLENILDSLFDKNLDDGDMISDNIVIPKRCTVCKNTIICSVLPTFISLSKIKIYVGIEQCPFFTVIKANESIKDS